MTKRTAIACLFGTAAFLQPLHGRCQDENVAWTTHVELRQWIPTGEGAEGHVEELTEGGRAFLRLRPPWFWMMRSREAHQLLVPGDIAPLLELHEYNTVRVVVRSTLTTGTIGGFWTHVNTEYDENLQGIPHFSQHTLAGDGSWYEITLRFSESPLVDWEKGVAQIFLGPKMSWRTPESEFTPFVAALEAQDQSAYLDFDRIEFLHVEETLGPPVITGFSPERGETGAIVEITGSGFAVPLNRNVVWFGRGSEAEILGGDSTQLTVRVPTGSSGPIAVQTSGGRATSTAEFTKLLPPHSLRKVAGDGQSASVGSELEGFVAELLDSEGEGLPGHTLSFEVTSGLGTLSTSEADTNDAGRASVVLTLGSSPGVTEVTVRAFGVVDAVFTATAIE